MRASAGGRLRRLLALAVLSVALSVATAAGGGHNFHRDFDVVWGEGNARFRDGGTTVELSLDERTGARLQSKQRYLFGRFDLEMKLVPGESAGTITSFYVSDSVLLHYSCTALSSVESSIILVVSVEIVWLKAKIRNAMQCISFEMS